LRVTADQDLGAIEVHLAALAGATFGRASIIVPNEAALDLALRLIAGVAKLRKLERGGAA
jgi:hypothetical protein